MKYNIQVGAHAATIELTLDGNGNFAGTIETSEFGNGTVSGKVTGANYSGVAKLDGYNVNLSAVTSGNDISGTLTHIFMDPKTFTGTQEA